MARRIKREERFLLLMPEYVWGGAETQFRYLIDYAEQHKWKLDVIIEHEFGKRNAMLKQDMTRMRNVRFYELDGNGTGNRKAIESAVALHILRNILRVRYRACLIYYAPDLVLAPVLCGLGLRVVYSERVDARTVFIHRKYQKGLRWCFQIVANSVYAAKKLERRTGRKVTLIRNGKSIVPQFEARENRKIYRVLVPAKIASWKNQMLMLQYLRDYPSFRGKLIFAGLVEETAYQEALDKFVGKNGLEERVEFMGYVEDMAEEYRKADLVILPSLSEGTPNVVLEAYLYGRPVIVSDIATERDVVKNPKLRFGIRDTAGVDACIQYVQNLTDEDYLHMLEINRAYVLKNYNIEKMAEKVYRILAGKREKKLEEKTRWKKR